jgi:hypothetical protein
MSGLSEMLIEEPWTRRVRAESTDRQPPAREVGDAPGPAPQAEAPDEPPGWDPYEVWLYRIRRPRRPHGGAEN